jgi:ribose transport system permease protein
MKLLNKLGISGNSVFLIGFIAVVFAGFGLAHPAYWSASNINNILFQATPVAIAAIGMTYVILLSDIDLSIGSTMYLSIVVATMLSSSGGDLMVSPSIWVYPIAIISGLVLGLINAILIKLLRINTLIVTLGALYMFRGLALALTNAGTQVMSGPISWFGSAKLGSVYVAVVFTILAAIVATLFLKYRSSGRLLYAIGSDPRSGRESGLSQVKARFIAFGLAGICAAVAGLIEVGQDGTLDATLGSDITFTVITAVVIGGTSLFGGKGSVQGSILGALLLAAIQNGLNALNASIYAYDVVQGVVLVAAIVFGAISQKSDIRMIFARILGNNRSLQRGN